MNVSLTPELDRFVQQKVATGLYQTASEVVRAGLRLLEVEDQLRAARIADVRGKIDRGLKQLNAGQGISAETGWKQVRKSKSSQRV